MTIAVFGLGKIGLPLAVQFAMKGHHVVGVDINTDVVDAVNHGEEPFPGEADLAHRLGEVVDLGRLKATTRGGEAVTTADAVVTAVPLYVDSAAKPDFSAIDAVANVIGDNVRKGTLISFETTLPVGTTRARIGAEISRRSGMEVGQDFHLVFSPERVLTGRVFEDLRRYPKLVGGVTQACEDAGVAFYESVLDFDPRADLDRPNGVWRMGSADAAELAKLAETTYRDVNIGLANQFARFAEKHSIDIGSVIQACNSQPYSHIHKPGVAVGGHCIPVYPRLYLWNDPEASIVRAARDMNASMPERVVARLESELDSLQGVSVAVLGAAYRGGVKETAFSGVFPTVLALEARGATVQVHDPLYTHADLVQLGLRPFDRGQPTDAVIVQADHAEYLEWTPEDIPGVRVIIDGRGYLAADVWDSACTFLRIGS